MHRSAPPVSNHQLNSIIITTSIAFVYYLIRNFLFYLPAFWTQETQLTGDFYAQNSDAQAPGDLAPWYTRFGHSLNVLKGSSYNMTDDLMILAGGYSPETSNDVWLTPDGSTWYYTGHQYPFVIFLTNCTYVFYISRE